MAVVHDLSTNLKMHIANQSFMAHSGSVLGLTCRVCETKIAIPDREGPTRGCHPAVGRMHDIFPAHPGKLEYGLSPVSQGLQKHDLQPQRAPEAT